MNIKLNKLRMLLPTVALIASCTEVSDSIETQPTESQISITTRSDASLSGETLKLSDGVETATYTYSGSSWNSTSPLCWNSDGSALSLSGYIVKTGAAANSVTLGEAGATIDQSGTNLDSYDYLYYYDDNVEDASLGNLEIELEHVMTKVVVKVNVGDSGYTISSLSIPSPISMSTSTGIWTPGNSTLSIIANSDSNYTAYVVPTSYVADEYLIEVAVDSNDTISASYSSSVDFEAGKVYTFALSLSATGDSATLDTISVTDWVDGDDWGSLNAQKVWSGAASATDGAFGGGSGTEEEPFLISSAEHLAELAQIVNDGTVTYDSETDGSYSYVNKYIKLTTDIDLNNLPWTPIGYSVTSSITSSFSGRFDGDGHTISNVNIAKDSDSGYCVGLFGCYRTYGTATTWIKNLTIKNATISSDGSSLGTLVGYINNGVGITDCNVENSTITYSAETATTSGNVGGLVGQFFLANNSAYGCEIKNLSINAMNGSNAVGGLIGSTGENVTIVGCSVDATLTVSGGKTGGLIGDVGYKTYDSTAATDKGQAEGGIGVNVAYIYGCYTTGSIEKSTGTTSNAGGLVNSCSGYLIGCYSSMTNNATSNRGGLVNQYNTITDYPASTLFQESYFINNSEVNSGYPIRIVSHNGTTLATGDSSDGDTYSGYYGEGSNNYKVSSTSALAGKIGAMNTAISGAGCSWQYEASSENEAFPYVLVSNVQ
ncbi:MAG: hypothetical protein R3Y68_09880 [Rikenellaceae bacterium]